MSALIAINQLTKVYPPSVPGGEAASVLRGVSMTIERGEFVAIMGPSGSGKSTLMHILGFLDTGTGGTYFFQGRDVSKLDEAALARARRTQVGFVFQAFFLLPKLSVLENVILPLMYQGVPLKDRDARAKAAIAEVGLTHRMHYATTRLSGGEKQRVAIARALVGNPDVLFADEPTGNLDSVSGAQVMALLTELNARGRTIILVTHETTTAECAQRIVRLRDGLIVDDTPVLHRSDMRAYVK